MNDLVLAFLGVLLLGVAFLAPPFLRRATERRKAYEKHAGIFFQKAEALASDADTPDDLLATLEFMTSMVATRCSGCLLASMFIAPKGWHDSDEGKAAREAYEAQIAPFMKARPELAAAFSDAVSSWTYAMLLNSKGLIGLFVRATLGRSVSLLDPKRVGGRLNERRRHDNHNHNGHAPAAA